MEYKKPINAKEAFDCPETTEQYFRPKFSCLFQGCDLSVLNDELINKLIGYGVFIRESQYSIYDLDLEYEEPNSKEFNTSIYYNSRRYILDDEVLKELYFMLKCYVSGIEWYEYENPEDKETDYSNIELGDELEEVFFKLNKYVDIKDQIKFLKKQYKKRFPKEEGYSDYIGDEDSNNTYYNCAWGFHVNDYLTDSMMLIKLYLTMSESEYCFGELVSMVLQDERDIGDDSLEKLLEKWFLFYSKEFELKVISNKIEELRISLNRTNKKDSKNTSTSVESLNDQCYTALEIAYYAYYMSETDISFLNLPFPSERAYKKLSMDFNKDWKNIQKSYLSICINRNLRLKKGRDKKIEKIKGLLTPKALSLAEQEIMLVFD